jgi:hypothetical protein
MIIGNLKVGIIYTKKNVLPAWEYEMLIQLLKSEFISDVLLIHYPLPESEEPFRKKSLGYRMFTAFENRWFARQPDAGALTDVWNLKEYGNKLKKIDIPADGKTAIAGIDLLYTSFPDHAMAVSDIPRLGLWYIQFGEEKFQGTGIPGFREVMRREITTDIQLRVKLKGNSRDKIAYHSIGTTVPFSVKNNFNAMAWKACGFLPARLRTIRLTGPEQFFKRCSDAKATMTASVGEKKYLNPSSLEVLFLFLKNGLRYLISKLERFIKKENFILLWSNTEKNPFIPDIDAFTPLLPGKRNFWADPFVIEKNGGKFIFFEEYSTARKKAHLAVITMDTEGKLSAAKPVLDKPYHLSYPFVFENKSNYYLIPESSKNKTLELYRSVKFPFEWEFIKFLMVNVEIQDATLLYYQDTWWCFGTAKSPKSSTSNDKLLIYFSKDLLGEWLPHHANPVITDVSNCRPAGSIFLHAGKLYRPAQNNASSQYGYSIKINEIQVLNQSEYREKMVQEISPDNHKNFKAIHTINFTEGLMVIDGIMKRKSIFRS